MTRSAQPRARGEISAAPGLGRLSAVQGTALYAGAVLGTGVITLPALAARVAGPASLLAWLALAILSAPLATTFAALGARYPDAGGVATYVRIAFGDRAATVVGWCFFFANPLGGPAASLWVGYYVSAATGGGKAVSAITAMSVLVIVPVTNAFGAHITGRISLGLASLLMVFLVTAIVLSLPSARMANLRPFAPHGWFAIGPAAALLVWCFAGWEAMAHLTAEFRRPARDVPRATAAAVLVVGVMYLAIAFATVTVLGPAGDTSTAPLGDLLATGLGGNARVLAAVVATLLTMGTMNAYYAGGMKLGAALARDGSLPGWLAGGSQAGRVPYRSLAVLSAIAMLALLVDMATGVGPLPLVQLTSGLFVMVYAFGVAAAIRLLPRRSMARRVAVIAFAVVVVLLAVSGPYLVCPLFVAGAALLYLRLSKSRKPGQSESSVPTG